MEDCFPEVEQLPILESRFSASFSWSGSNGVKVSGVFRLDLISWSDSYVNLSSPLLADSSYSKLERMSDWWILLSVDESSFSKLSSVSLSSFKEPCPSTEYFEGNTLARLQGRLLRGVNFPKASLGVRDGMSSSIIWISP